MNCDIWNILHDGSIESVAGAVPGDLTLRIGIQYLCDQLPTAADHLWLHLRGCTRFEYEPFDGSPISKLEEIATRDIEILSADRTAEIITVMCGGGMLRLTYRDVEARLAESAVVTQTELAAAANRSVAEWLRENGRSP